MSNELKVINILTNWLIINEDSDTAEMETYNKLFEVWPDEYQIKNTMESLNYMGITRQKIEIYIKQLNIK